MGASPAPTSSVRPPRRPVHYRFVSVDDECPPPIPPNGAPSFERTSLSSHGEGEEFHSSSRLTLLRQFYDELILPAFPLEEERDDLDDWLECFRMQSQFRQSQRRAQRDREVQNVLTEGLGEPGLAKAVHRMTTDDTEEECGLEGPAMDVILMVQDNRAPTEEKGRRFYRRSRRSLLRRQSSLYSGLYAPTEEKGGEAGVDGNATSANNGTDDLQTRLPSRGSVGSLCGGLYATIHEEGDGTERTEHYQEAGGGEEKKEEDDAPNNYTIIGGAAVEYYRQSRVGLLSYVVLHSDYRGCGLARPLHEEALARLEMLAERYGTPLNEEASFGISRGPAETETGSRLRAVFAETNTPAAGDVSPEQSLLRHGSLFNLGYRLVHFPYAQPPLSTEDVDGSFDDIVLLVYFPYEAGELDDVDVRNDEAMQRYCSWYLERQNGNSEGKYDTNVAWMDVGIPFGYIEDFYQSVFGYDCEGIPDYHAAEYYRLARWFAHNHCQGGVKGVEVSLSRPTPWEDCKERLLLEWKGSESEDNSGA